MSFASSFFYAFSLHSPNGVSLFVRFIAVLFACVRAFNDGANEYYSIEEMFSFKPDCFVFGFGVILPFEMLND